MSNIQNVPPDNPPDPPSSSLFPESIPSQLLANPFGGQPARESEEAQHIPPIGSITEESLKTAVLTVVAVIQRGYHPNRRDLTPISAADWAKLSCLVLAAVGRGYDSQYTVELDGDFSRARAEAFDPEPLTPECPTYFHRLANTAESVARLVELTSALSDINQNTACVVSNRTDSGPAPSPTPMSTPNAMSLAVVLATPIAPKAPEPTPRRGRARMLTRSKTTAVLQDNANPAQDRERSVASRDQTTPVPDRSSSPKRARAPTRSTSSLFRRRLNPMEVDADAQTAPLLTLSPRATVNLRVKEPPPPPASGPPAGFDNIMAAVQAALGTALTAAMAPWTAKIEALEKASKPPPVTRYPPPAIPPTAAPNPRPEGQGNQSAPPSHPPNPTVHRDPGFILIDRQSKKWKGKSKANTTGGAAAQPAQATPTPASYANAAAGAVSTQQPQPTRKQIKATTITEITVIRTGCLFDPETENGIQRRAADAIVREVRIQMAKAVAKPIPLRAGRWSIHPRSKGNFVFSFDGSIPFNLIQSYERLLLEPFYGSGQLCPSMGWTRFLVHSVPIWDDETCEPFSPDALLSEVRLMPGLKKAVFAMPPRWLKPPVDDDNAESYYSSITFALSDPDGRTTNALLNGRSALFGKEVTVRKWVDKPALIQCSRCHALGHSKSSKACQLGKDSVKCFICGGAHRSETHDRQCTKPHAYLGICDCTHFKCLNCHNRGHNCRDVRCPKRDLYRPRGGKGKARATDPTVDQNQNAVGGPSRHPNTHNPPLTQTDIDRMEEYERAENIRMEWERDNDEYYETVGDRAAAHESPAAPPAPALPAPPAERNTNEQAPAFSPSRLNRDANATPMNHD
jgi:hypothetical protein